MTDLAAEKIREDAMEEFFGAQASAPLDDTIKHMETFLHTYTSQLRNMEEAISESISEPWNPYSDPINLYMSEPSLLNNMDISPLVLIQEEEEQKERDDNKEDNNDIVNSSSSDTEIKLNRIIKIFSMLTIEINELITIAKTKFYSPLTLFSHNQSGNNNEDNDMLDNNNLNDFGTQSKSPELEMGDFLPLLQKLSNFISHIKLVVKNIIQQLSHLYYEKNKIYNSNFKTIQLNSVFESLSSLLRIPITLDAIIRDNKSLISGWASYKRMMKYVRADHSKFIEENEMNTAKLHSFETLLLNLDTDIFNGRIFLDIISQDFTIMDNNDNNLNIAEDGKSYIVGNRVFLELFDTQLKNTYHDLERAIQHTTASSNTPQDQVIETFDRIQIVDLLSLYSLYRSIFKTSLKPEKNFYRKLWDIQVKIPLVYLYGRSCFFIGDFLVNWKIDTKSTSDTNKNLISFLKNLDDHWLKNTQSLYVQTCIWMVRFESEWLVLDGNQEEGETSNGDIDTSFIGSVLGTRAKLLLHGMFLANQIRTQFTLSIMLHLKLNQPFRKQNVRAMAVYAEMAKAIQFTYHRRSSIIAESIGHMIGQSKYTLKRIFNHIKTIALSQQTKRGKLQSGILSIVNLFLKTLNDGTTTMNRRIIQRLASEVCHTLSSNILKTVDQDEIRYQLWKLDILYTWQKKLSKSCCVEYLYWCPELLIIMFRDIFNNPDQAQRLPYLLVALRDPSTFLLPSPSLQPQQEQQQTSSQQTSNDDDESKKIWDIYQQDILRVFSEEIVDPLCREIENDLRLHIHSVVLQQATLQNRQVKHLSRLLQLKPLPFFDSMIDLKERVGLYLDITFYNLTTVALHDWRIYAEMRNLAYEKYGINLSENHLPGHSHYSQGLDVLEIMRNIHIFVSKYSYNLNTQTFIERTFDQKHLNTIDIQHIANSIRTHGVGITNTTINFTYQFMAQKFLIFSEFLYDDHVKSRLLKDIRWFRDNRLELDNTFPFERAERFNRDIRRLGNIDGRSYLDMFRILLTEIGNSLGYVRMVRSGNMQHSSSSIKFVPDVDDIVQFSPIVIKEGLSKETIAAATNLDSVLESLSKNFAEGTDYFQIVLDVFSRVIESSQDQQHLKNFYIIIPPLTVNFVEHMLECKEKLNKKSGKSSEASFTDDGFALGLAYFLKLLEQNIAFDSLHWFDSIFTKLDKEANELEKQLKKSKREQAQTLQLTIRRVNMYKMEYKMLFYSFNGARIFFRDTTATSIPPVSAPVTPSLHSSSQSQPPSVPSESEIMN